jgi:phosphatidylglycerol:prolipoprotein diacylglycerol transferase
MTFQYIVWDVDPEIFRAGSFAVRWYGLLFASSFVAGYFVGLRIIRREGLSPEWLDRLAIYVGLGTILGARLGHCLFYEPAYYLSHPFEILKVWEGGLASHGAAVGILFSLYLFQKKAGRSYLWIVDRLVPLVALGGAFIRTGNLMNSEIYGHETTLPWAFQFLRDDLIPRHPTQIYEALFCLVLFGVLLYGYYHWNWGKMNGMMLGVFLATLFLFRFFVEFLKENQVRFEEGMTLNMGQWLSIPFVIAGVILIYQATGGLFKSASSH